MVISVRMDSGRVIQALIMEGQDDRVLKRLYGTIYPKVRQYILKNGGSKENAEDLFQDSILVIYTKATEQKLNEIENVGGFIMQSVKNRWINQVKKADRHAPLSSTQELADDYHFLENLHSLEKTNTIDWMMSQIGEKCKELLLLSVFQKFSMEEIAIKLNFTNANAAKTANYRCKEKLIQLVEKHPGVKIQLSE